MKGPGYIAVTAGEVVHVIKCIPVDVMIQHGDKCCAELKVIKGNSTYFLTPRTHMIKERGPTVSCNTILPSYYLVEGSWYKLLPKPTEGVEPITIQPSAQATWEYISPAYLATSGIYTQKDLEELRDKIMFPVIKSSLLNDVAREIHGHTVANHDGTLMNLINEDTIENIIE